MAKDHLLCQPEEKKPQIAKASWQTRRWQRSSCSLNLRIETTICKSFLPSDKENKGALALSTWGEKTTNCKSFLAKRRWQRGADSCSQPKKENKTTYCCCCCTACGEGGPTNSTQYSKSRNLTARISQELLRVCSVRCTFDLIPAIRRNFLHWGKKEAVHALNGAKHTNAQSDFMTETNNQTKPVNHSVSISIW